MTRRPPELGLGHVLLVLFCFSHIPFLVTAQQQRSPQANEPNVEARRNSWTNKNGPVSDASVSVESNAIKSLKKHKNIKDAASPLTDVRALATLAPAGRLTQDGDVRAPPARSTVPTGGLTSRLPARSLQDWEVEDIVLMATVDGMIHARDRKTGSHRWALAADRPMVETIYHNRNESEPEGGSQQTSTQDFYWIVEPSQDGTLYGYTPGSPYGMVKLGLTVKQLVEDISPWEVEDPPVVYTGEKKNTLYTLDVQTGNLLKVFAPGSSSVFDQGVCRQVDGLEALDEDACGKTATLTLGRTDYTVGIQSSINGDPICTIRYFEWGPNNRDRDLAAQYSATKDNRYIYSLYDGRVMALDHLRQDDSSNTFIQKPMFKQKFPSPVVRVFDVARPLRSTTLDTPLVVLPQPVGPSSMANSFITDDNRIFVNCTEAGSWYALSETEYPMVTDGALPAHSSRADWLYNMPYLGGTADEQLKKALVGVHALSYSEELPREIPTISGPTEAVKGEPPICSTYSLIRIAQSFFATVHATNRFQIVIAGKPSKEPTTNEALIALGRSSRRDVGTSSLFQGLIGVLFICMLVYIGRLNFPGYISNLRSKIPPFEGVLENPLAQKQTEPDLHEEPKEVENIEEIPLSVSTTKAVRFEEDNQEDNKIATEGGINTDEKKAGIEESSPPTEELTTKPKKKAHRGSRGGKREVEKRRIRQIGDLGDEVDGIVEGVKQMGQDVVVTPDAVSHSGSTLTDSSKGLHNLTFSTDSVLGTGSGGTIVYKGTFEGRDVAVKRMLTVHYELASQEVSLLEQSEDHPNVIRYFCRREDFHFLYIALELCQASLFDLFKDNRRDMATTSDPMHAQLIDDINREPVAALRQLAEGIKHLHALRIVHRDIKPQNMLIAYPKKNSLASIPRLVISDFGLCKTLPEGASTLIGATVNAGTTGWKAPELISQPRDASGVSGSHNSVSNSSVQGDQLAAPGAPGVKRAVDIFSLGCVFFYVLTQGLHPFDDEEGWMALRERNIKTNRCNLSAIEIHGPDTIDLIGWMLSPKPEDRPTAAEVLAHPFFWNPEDRLEFLSLVSDRFDMEPRDGSSDALNDLESHAESIIGRNGTNNDPSSSEEPNFFAHLDRKFTDTLGKQRKYNGAKLADLLRALRNKHHHWDDMPEDVKLRVGEVPEGYLRYWEQRFPGLVVGVWRCVRGRGIGAERRFWRWFGGRGG